MILQSPITRKEGSVKVAFLLQDLGQKAFPPRENPKCNSFELLKSLMYCYAERVREQPKTLKCVEMRSPKDEAVKFFQD